MHRDLYGCNHHHPMNGGQEIVDFGTGPFVADKPLLPLLKAMNDLGLVTRTHDYTRHPNGTATAFVGVILDKRVRLEIKHVTEPDADREIFRGQQEVLMSWEPV